MKKLMAIMGLAMVIGAQAASPTFHLVSLIPSEYLPLQIQTETTNLSVATFGKVDISGMEAPVFYFHAAGDLYTGESSNSCLGLQYSYDGTTWHDGLGTNWWFDKLVPTAAHTGTNPAAMPFMQKTNLCRPLLVFPFLEPNPGIKTTNLEPEMTKFVKWVRLATVTNYMTNLYITNVGFVGWK